MRAEKIMHIEIQIFNLLRQWKKILSPPPQRKLPVALFFKWRSEERQHVHFVPALEAEVEDTDADSDVDDDEEGMQVELV